MQRRGSRASHGGGPNFNRRTEHEGYLEPSPQQRWIDLERLTIAAEKSLNARQVAYLRDRGAQPGADDERLVAELRAAASRQFSVLDASGQSAVACAGPLMQSSVRQRDGGNGRAWAEPLSECVSALPVAAPCCFDDNPPSVPLPGGLALCMRARVCASLPTSLPPSAPLMFGCWGRGATPTFGAEVSDGATVPLGLPVGWALAAPAAQTRRARAARAARNRLA